MRWWESTIFVSKNKIGSQCKSAYLLTRQQIRMVIGEGYIYGIPYVYPLPDLPHPIPSIYKSAGVHRMRSLFTNSVGHSPLKVGIYKGNQQHTSNQAPNQDVWDISSLPTDTSFAGKPGASRRCVEEQRLHTIYNNSGHSPRRFGMVGIHGRSR